MLVDLVVNDVYLALNLLATARPPSSVVLWLNWVVSRPNEPLLLANCVCTYCDSQLVPGKLPLGSFLDP